MRFCRTCRAVYVSQAEFCGLDGERLIESEADPLIGQRIDRYVLKERLGAGGMACVYRAEHEVLGTEHAIKLLFGEMASDRNYTERLRREARAVAKIDHPNVVKVLDCGVTSEGLAFLVMELLRGRTLDHAIDVDEDLDAERTVRIIRQVALGLAEAHRAGFVHRDLKPPNVMLIGSGQTEQAKILDFGLVQKWDYTGESPEKLTGTGLAIGTPHYMAPERLRGHPATPQADLYGLGAVLYEMLTGKTPFRGSVPEVVAQQLTGTAPPPLSRTGLEPLCMRLLSRRPEDRPKTAEEVIAALDTVVLRKPEPGRSDDGAVSELSVHVPVLTTRQPLQDPAESLVLESSGDQTRAIPESRNLPIHRRWMVRGALGALLLGAAGGAAWDLSRRSAEEEAAPPPPPAHVIVARDPPPTAPKPPDVPPQPAGSSSTALAIDLAGVRSATEAPAASSVGTATATAELAQAPLPAPPAPDVESDKAPATAPAEPEPVIVPVSRPVARRDPSPPQSKNTANAPRPAPATLAKRLDRIDRTLQGARGTLPSATLGAYVARARTIRSAARAKISDPERRRLAGEVDRLEKEIDQSLSRMR